MAAGIWLASFIERCTISRKATPTTKLTDCPDTEDDDGVTAMTPAREIPPLSLSFFFFISRFSDPLERRKGDRASPSPSGGREREGHDPGKIQLSFFLSSHSIRTLNV